MHSSPPGKFAFMSWEVVMTTSGVFKYLWSEQNGNAPFLHTIQQDILTLNIQNVHCVFLL